MLYKIFLVHVSVFTLKRATGSFAKLKYVLQMLHNPCTGKMAMMTTSGGTILVTMPVLMMNIGGVEKCMVMTLTVAASTVSSQPTVCTAPTATTADEAASALGRNR